jgi:hypothetical protein
LHRFFTRRRFSQICTDSSWEKAPKNIGFNLGESEDTFPDIKVLILAARIKKKTVLDKPR